MNHLCKCQRNFWLTERNFQQLHHLIVGEFFRRNQKTFQHSGTGTQTMHTGFAGQLRYLMLQNFLAVLVVAQLLLGFGFFLVWCAATVLWFADYKALYLSTLNTEYPSYGAAITCLKLVMVLCGLTALIPVAPAPTGREYAHGLARAYEKQNIEQAKNAAEEAQKDLERRVEQLRSSLSAEELEALMAKLQTEKPADTADAPAEASAKRPEAMEEK